MLHFQMIVDELVSSGAVRSLEQLAGLSKKDVWSEAQDAELRAFWESRLATRGSENLPPEPRFVATLFREAQAHFRRYKVTVKFLRERLDSMNVDFGYLVVSILLSRV